MLEQPKERVVLGKAPSPTARIDVVNRTLNAMYVHRPLPLTYREITEAADLHPTTVSLGLSTARDIGFTVLAGRKGLYNFTQAGEDYSRNLNGKRLSESKNILRRTILSNPLWKDVISFLKANAENPRDPIDLTIEIERRLGKKWSQAMRKTVSDSLISILEFGELVRSESGKIIPMIGPEERPEPIFNLPPPPTMSPFTDKATSNFFEVNAEGVYMRIGRDDQSIALAKALLELFGKRIQRGSKTTNVEEAPGTS
jgi:hypothetical protein